MGNPIKKTGTFRNVLGSVAVLLLLYGKSGAEPIGGKVIDSQSKAGISGAQVTVKNTTLQDVTASDGSFSMEYDTRYIDIVMEAEDMNLTNYLPEVFTGRTLVKVDPNLPLGTTGSATGTFTGTSGTYTIIFAAVPERDGSPVVKLYVAGRQVWTQTYPREDRYYTPASDLLEYTITGVTVNQGDLVRVEGTSDGLPDSAAFARWDKLTLQYTGPAGITDVQHTLHNMYTIFKGGNTARIVWNDGSLPGIKLYTTSGRLVDAKSTVSAYTLPRLAEGVYIMEFNTGQHRYLGKVVVSGAGPYISSLRSDRDSRAKAAATVTLVANKTGYREKEQSVTTGSTNLVIELDPIASGGYPVTPSEVGPTNTSNLSSISGRTISTNGTVLENVRINGVITIRADNVTVRNFIITTGDYFSFDATGSNVLIEDGELDGGNTCDEAFRGSGYTARRLYIHNYEGDAFKAGSNCVIERCYITTLGQGVGAHGDGVQMMGGTDIQINYNNFELTSGSLTACIFPGGGGFVSNIHVEGNRLNGGGWVIYCGNSTMTVINNVFGPDYGYGPHTDECTVWSGNVWESTGQPCL